MSSNSLTQAIDYITLPLMVTYSPAQVLLLRFHLYANLSLLSLPCSLSFTPTCLPSQPIHSACLSSGIQWLNWMKLLGNRQFELLIHSDRVLAQFAGMGDEITTVWQNPRAEAVARIRRLRTKVLDEQLTSSESASAPITLPRLLPVLTPLSIPENVDSADESPISRPPSALSLASLDSGSSRTSISPGSSPEIECKPLPLSSPPRRRSKPASEQEQKPLSRRSRARLSQMRPFVDSARINVTPYDGGKVGVLTGGVMLSAKTPPAGSKTAKYTVPARRARA